jgi:hypothetical protein
MPEIGKYRHELKYQTDYFRYLELRPRLKAVMHMDGHGDELGRYLIRSVYFDNYRDKALREKIDGVPYREKFRIRYYNDDLSFITLEKKIKRAGLCLKLDAPITQQQCADILGGDIAWMPHHPSPVVQELYCKMKGGMLRPRVTVSYKRQAFLFPAGNVRVTFDSDIRTSLYSTEFMKPHMVDISACDDPGNIIMEVKYDEFLPEVISHIIQTDGLRQCAFSKYAACRRFG